jgi:NADH:ubiquinone oxidoreductase subunit 6 (subunit J)
MSRLAVFMLASFAVGAGLMLVFDRPLTRVLGVLALFAFIVSGVFLVAEPGFLAADEQEDEQR